MEEPPKKEKAHCNRCAGETNHLAVATRSQSGADDPEYDPMGQITNYPTSWDDTYVMLECAGCEAIVVRRTFVFSEWNHGESEVTFYPPRISRRLPAWKSDLSDDVEELLEEVYKAIQAKSFRLAAMGARTLFDLIALQEVGDAGRFDQKLDEMVSKGLLGSVHRTALESAIDAGSAAVHRGHRPEEKDLDLIMDIIENVLQATILSGEKISEMKKRTPPRKK
ncbi:MAG: hypothetical protein ACJAQ3_003526 [Planctomycetota bacterium]|jgi:uncharacterized protein (UPF0297 family)